MLNAPLRIVIVAALCVLSLIGLVVRESAARAAGTEVLLAMEAVDPRALLSGHYVIVGLAEALPPEQDCAAAPATVAPRATENRWLSLRPDDGRHRLAGAAPTRDEAAKIGPVPVLGSSFCNPRLLGDAGAVLQPATERIDLGISRFHINQADAERIDRILRAQTPGGQVQALAIISIGRDGRARLKGLMIDGERLELRWL